MPEIISRSWLGSCMWCSRQSGLARTSSSPADRVFRRSADASSGGTPPRRTGMSRVCGSHGASRAAARWVSAPLEEPTKATSACFLG